MCIEIDKANKIWIGSRYFGIAILDGTNWSYIPTSAMKISHIESGVISISFSEDGTVWVGTVAERVEVGRVVYLKNNTWYQYPKSELSNNLARQIIIWNGNVVFATKFGLGILNNANVFKYYKEGNSKLYELLVRQAIVDNHGNIWIGTSSCGAAKLKGEF